MKRIADLDKLIPHPDADEIDESLRPNEAQKKGMGVPRRMLRVMFMNLPPQGPEQSDTYSQIALKLRQTGDFVDFEDSEFNTIFDKVKANAMGWPGHIHHYIVELLRAAEKRKLEIKVEEVK